MMFLKTLVLMVFAFGVAIIAKYVGFYPWVENVPLIGLPMIAFGAVGIVLLYGGDEP